MKEEKGRGGRGKEVGEGSKEVGDGGVGADGGKRG